MARTVKTPSKKPKSKQAKCAKKPKPPKAQVPKDKIAEAVAWLLSEEGQQDGPATASRLFGIPNDAATIRKRLQRERQKTRNQHGLYNTHGVNNKMLTKQEEGQIIAYAAEEAGGLGTNKPMIRAAINTILQRQTPPRAPPSDSWFNKWFDSMKTRQLLHTITTKPIARDRLETHSEDDIAVWFKKLRADCIKFKIDRPEKMYNMDETGARVGCPASEEVVVPFATKELYTASPENRRSVTIKETIRADGEVLPAFVIAPGQHLMENWIAPQLSEHDYITCSDTGYTNNDIIMEYLDWFIEITGQGPEKPWKMLLLDGHSTHEYEPFVI